MTIRRLKGNALIWIALLVVLGASGGWLLTRQARRFSTTVAQTEAEKQDLVNARTEMQDQLKALEHERSTLAFETERLKSERDVLVNETSKLKADADSITWVTDLQERVLKQTAAENRGLKGELVPLKKDYDQLQQVYRDVLRVNDELQNKLAEEKQRAQGAPLAHELAEEQNKAKQSSEALREARAELKMLQAQHSKNSEKSEKLRKQLESLQDKYTSVMSKNKSLANRAEKVPKDVTLLAREHEQLVKDLVDTHYNMGVLFLKSDDYARAVKEFQKVLELKPEDPETHYNLGLIYAEHLPDTNLAMAHFRKYLEISPQAEDASWVKQYIASWRAWDAEDRLE